MKALLYVNKEKNLDGKILEKLKSSCEKYSVSYEIMEDVGGVSSRADVLIVVGGDGTILALSEFAGENKIPIVGINAGRLGFLTEFELSELDQSIEMLVFGKLKSDERINLEVVKDGKSWFALNDLVLQRIYRESVSRMILKVDVRLDDVLVDEILGDGIIISSPTGSTAYSLSAGGSILAPGIDAFSMTPLSAHSLHHRPVIFSANTTCKVNILGEVDAGMFLDGKLITTLKGGESVIVKKADFTTTFLRKEDSNFYARLIKKLKSDK